MRPSHPGSHVVIPWFLFANIMMGRGPPQRKWRSHSTRSPGHTQRGTQPLLQTCWDLCSELTKKEPGSFRIRKSPSFQVSNSPVSQDHTGEVPPISEPKEHITTTQEKVEIKAWLFSSSMSAFFSRRGGW